MNITVNVSSSLLVVQIQVAWCNPGRCRFMIRNTQFLFGTVGKGNRFASRFHLLGLSILSDDLPFHPYKLMRFFDKINVLVYRWSGFHARNCEIRKRLCKQERQKLRLIKDCIERIHYDNPIYTEQWRDEEAERWMKTYFGHDVEYVRNKMYEKINRAGSARTEKLKRMCELAELKEALLMAVSETINAEIKRVLEGSTNGCN